MTVTDPCISSLIQVSELLPESMSVRPGRTSEELIVTGPTNSVSVEYGNGYNMCGPLGYEVLSEETRKPARSSQFILYTRNDLEQGDKLTLKLKSAAGNGPILTEDLVIKMYLT